MNIRFLETAIALAYPFRRRGTRHRAAAQRLCARVDPALAELAPASNKFL